jgi:hypothetical protein
MQVHASHASSLLTDVCAHLPAFTCLPAFAQGTLRVYDLMVDGGNVVCEIQAHKGPLVGGAAGPGSACLVHRSACLVHRSGACCMTFMTPCLLRLPLWPAHCRCCSHMRHTPAQQRLQAHGSNSLQACNHSAVLIRCPGVLACHACTSADAVPRPCRRPAWHGTTTARCWRPPRSRAP